MTHPVFLFRDFRLTDIPELMTIAKNSMPFPWRESVFKECANPGYHGFVLQHSLPQKNKIIGFAIARKQIDDCELMNICVDRTFQNKGFGKQLLNKIIDWAKSESLKHIFLEVRRSNQQAIRFYEQMGFTKMGERKNYYPSEQGREDALTYKTSL